MLARTHSRAQTCTRTCFYSIEPFGDGGDGCGDGGAGVVVLMVVMSSMVLMVVIVFVLRHISYLISLITSSLILC